MVAIKNLDKEVSSEVILIGFKMMRPQNVIAAKRKWNL